MISVITVVYNAAKDIEQTILSVIAHKNSELEYIIVDGGSSDGTVEIIRHYQDQISVWISESDNGIYAAMNKGIALAKGDYVCFINCGDRLLSVPTRQIFENQPDLACFPVALSSGETRQPLIGRIIKLKNTLPHQGCFYRNDEQLRFDEQFRVFADFALNQKLYKEGRRIQTFNDPIVAHHDLGGISHDRKHASEIFKVVRSNYGLIYQSLSWFYFKYQGLKARLA
jgi:glycosyltransferase involved in cell wall biosynthesis